MPRLGGLHHRYDIDTIWRPTTPMLFKVAVPAGVSALRLRPAGGPSARA